MYFSPKTTNDGLVLHLDAANTRSYPGTGTTWFDLSGRGNHATIYNSPTFTANNQGTFNFDESNDYVKVNNTALLSTVSYTKIAWFRPESSAANIISGGGSDGQHAFWMNGTDNTLASGHNGAWTTVSYSPGNMLNQWWMGAVTFSNVSGWKLYLNGESVATSATNTSPVSGNTVRIGAYGDATNLFDGDIPIAQIYNRVLTPDEIRRNYNSLKSRFNI